MDASGVAPGAGTRGGPCADWSPPASSSEPAPPSEWQFPAEGEAAARGGDESERKRDKHVGKGYC